MTSLDENGDSLFVGSIPTLYQRLLVPMIFFEPARALVDKVASFHPVDVLETAAGTGVVTRELSAVGGMSITATDLNGPMIAMAQDTAELPGVRWQVADALDLPFADDSFDVVVCQFGVMFFPDRVRGYTEAARVLRPGGTFVFNAWDRLETNEAALGVTEALVAATPDEPLEFMRRTPHGYFDAVQIRADLEAAGLRDIEVDFLDGTSTTTAADGALAYCQGTPLRGDIEKHSTFTLESATALARDGLEERFGSGTFDAPTRWLQVTARRPASAPD